MPSLLSKSLQAVGVSSFFGVAAFAVWTKQCVFLRSCLFPCFLLLLFSPSLSLSLFSFSPRKAQFIVGLVSGPKRRMTGATHSRFPLSPFHSPPDRIYQIRTNDKPTTTTTITNIIKPRMFFCFVFLVNPTNCFIPLCSVGSCHFSSPSEFNPSTDPALFRGEWAKKFNPRNHDTTYDECVRTIGFQKIRPELLEDAQKG